MKMGEQVPGCCFYTARGTTEESKVALSVVFVTSNHGKSLKSKVLATSFHSGNIQNRMFPLCCVYSVLFTPVYVWFVSLA